MTTPPPDTVTRPLRVGDRVASDYGPATITALTGRSVTFQVTDGPDAGTTLNIVAGTPGHDRLTASRTPHTRT